MVAAAGDEDESRDAAVQHPLDDLLLAAGVPAGAGHQDGTAVAARFAT